MENRYLFRGKRIDNGEWVEWNMLTGIPHDVHILKDTICQCTGLKDMNGKLIWENDIAKDNVIYGVVKWEDVNARYIIDDRDDGYQDYSEWWSEVEVIGNAIDNPELLE